MIRYLVCVLTACLLGACTGTDAQPGTTTQTLPRVFHTKHFAGLVSTEVTGYEDAVLDYELDTAEGAAIHFTRCSQVEDISEEQIDPSQYPLFRLLSVNCRTVREYAESVPAERTYFPPELTEDVVREFPANAVPRISDEDLARRQRGTLSDYDNGLQVSTEPDGGVRVTDATSEMVYYLMARGDFDGDGNEDLLVRVDWEARDALGRGTDLLRLSRTSEAAPVVVSWRL